MGNRFMGVGIIKAKYIFKICNSMQILDKDSIQRELQKINIPFDPQIIQEVQIFLEKYIGPLSQQDAQYHIPAACAIVCQTIKMTTIDKSSLTGTGIKMENVMRHVDSLSKQKFLNTIELQLKKSDFEKQYLLQKVINIKIAFRIFKKYKNIFERLSIQTKIPRANIQQLQAFFWIIYLITQHSLNTLENLNLRIKILIIMIQEFFCSYGQESREKIHQYIISNDNFPEVPQVTEQEEVAIKTQIYNQINSAIQMRDASFSSNLNNLVSNLPLLARLVDDLSRKYEKLYLSLPEGRFIDQITFLELTKNLTPQAIIFKNPKQQITKVINFGDDSDDEYSEQLEDKYKTEDKRPIFTEVESSQKSIATNLFLNFSLKPKSNSGHTRFNRSISDYTPVSLGNTKSTWAHSFIENFTSDTQNEIKNYFEGKGINYDEFIIKAKERISNQIQSLTRYSTSKQKSTNETLKMFFSFAYQLLQHKPNYEIASKKVIDSLICISAYLYTETVRYLPLELQKYSQFYNADLLDCLISLYDISQNVSLPLVIKQMLSQLQKQVLIKQLWDTDRGYLLLKEGKNPSNQIIFNRLNRRIYERIKQICEANKVDLSEVKKIQALLNDIMNKKPEILEINKLDQIIICSISACLNLNEAKYNLALSTIFQKYNSVSLSFHSNREVLIGKQDEGVPMSLLQFYNRVFIHEVQDMMSQQENLKYLYTPIRENHLQNVKDYSNPFPPVSRFSGSNDKSVLGGEGGLQNYRKQILMKMKSSDKAQDKDKQCESPYFGTNSNLKGSLSMKRKITFGDGQVN